MRGQLVIAGLALATGLFAVAEPAAAQFTIHKVRVTPSPMPICDVFPPAPASVSPPVQLDQGGVLSSDPFSDVPSLAGVSPYIFIGKGGSIVYKAPVAGNFFRLLWGSVGLRDQVTFLGSDGTTIATISGRNLIDAGVELDSNQYFLFHTPAPFASVMLSETSFAFEFSDVSFSAHAPKCPATTR